MKRRTRPPSPRPLARLALASLWGLGILMSAASARADGGTSDQPVGGPPRPSNHGPTVRRWYGYQTLLSDFLSTTLFAAGVATFDLRFDIGGGGQRRSGSSDVPGMLLLAGMTGYAFGGPAIHAAHGHRVNAGYSLGLRVGSVAAAAGIATAIDDPAVGPFVLLSAPLVAMILDTGLLAHETVPAEAPTVSLAPAYDPKQRSGSLALVGSF